MKALIAIAALLASVAVSAGELDGKALICRDISPNGGLNGYYFQDGKVFYSVLQRGETLTDVVVNDWNVADSYEVTIDTIEWSQSTDSHTVVDRKTLNIKFTWGSSKQEWNCELAESMDGYHQALEAERVKVEKRIAERMKDNKI